MINKVRYPTNWLPHPQENSDWTRFHEEYLRLIRIYEPGFYLSVIDLIKDDRDEKTFSFCKTDSSNGSLIAVIEAARVVYSSVQQLYINRLYVRPDCKRFGIGSHCLWELEQYGRALFSQPEKRFQILISLDWNNGEGIACFTSNGYQLQEHDTNDNQRVIFVKEV